MAQPSMTGGGGRSTAYAANVPSSAGVSQLDLVCKGRDTCRCEKDAVRGIMGPSAMDDLAGICELQLLHQRGGVQCRDGARPCTLHAAFQHTSHALYTDMGLIMPCPLSQCAGEFRSRLAGAADCRHEHASAARATARCRCWNYLWRKVHHDHCCHCQK